MMTSDKNDSNEPLFGEEFLAAFQALTESLVTLGELIIRTLSPIGDNAFARADELGMSFDDYLQWIDTLSEGEKAQEFTIWLTF